VTAGRHGAGANIAAMDKTNAALRLDLQSLACLDALIAESSVTRAAERMDMSQPAMSGALARLREVLQDPLLVRTPKGMVPTPYALEITVAMRPHLRGMQALLAQRGQFDPFTAEGLVSIATTDYTGVVLGPALMARLRGAAPNLRLQIKLPDPKHIREWLEEGSCDIGIGFFPELADGLHAAPLFEDTVSVLAATTHPTVQGSVSLAQFQEATHVIFGSPFAPLSTLETWVDEHLAPLNVTRKVGMQVPSALMPGYAVTRTDLLATLPTRLARHLAQTLPLQVLPLPFEAAPMTFSMVWHERTHSVPAYLWLREVLRELGEHADL